METRRQKNKTFLDHEEKTDFLILGFRCMSNSAIVEICCLMAV